MHKRNIGKAADENPHVINNQPTVETTRQSVEGRGAEWREFTINEIKTS